MPKRKRRKHVFSGRTVCQIPCKHCGAEAGEMCWTPKGVQTRAAHWARHADYEIHVGVRKPRGTSGMKVTFVCPVCSGPHAKQNHPG